MNNEIIYNQPMKYKEICEMFEDEFLESRGNKRANQLKRWNKKYLVTKNKTFYTIERPLTEEELEIVNNEDTFVANIERILLNEIKINGTGYQAVLTNKELFEKLKLVNDKYYKAKFKEFYNYLNKIIIDNHNLFGYNGNKERKGSSYLQAEKELQTYFYETNGLLRTLVFDCLKSLQRKDLIIYSKSFKLTKTETFKNEDGEDINFTQSYITTPEEDSIILGIIDDVKKEMNITGSLHFLTSIKKKEYYNKIDELIKERFDYEHCHEAVRIILSEKAIKRDLNRLELIINSKKSNNKKSVNKINSSKVLNNKMSTKRIECFTRELIDCKTEK